MASRRILFDVEEAIAREVRRITSHDNRTVTDVVLNEIFDPFTGEVIRVPVEPSFYDSSVDASQIKYPHFFIRLMKVREDLYTDRVNGQQWGKQFSCPNEELGVPVSATKAYEQVLPMDMGNISALGNDFTFTNFRARRIQVGHLLRVLNGNNIGTYTVDSVTIGSPSTITVSNDLLTDVPSFLFESLSREIIFQESVDLTTLKVGDIITDSSSNAFNITAIDNDLVRITIDGSITPDTSVGSVISRSGNVFQTIDPDPVCFVVLDPAQPILNRYGNQIISGSKNIDASIPIDMFYMVRIDSKERNTHIEILNRMLEEFNPMRSAIPVIIRSKNSAETALAADVITGGSSTITVEDNSNLNINDSIYIFNDLTPTKSSTGGFESPFQANVIAKTGTTSITLDKTVPDTFLIQDNTKIVSNADFQLLFFHFVDHNTKDVEGAQYWVHEFSFWVQAYVDRQGEATEYSSNINDVSTPIENIDGIEIIGDL